MGTAILSLTALFAVFDDLSGGRGAALARQRVQSALVQQIGRSRTEGMEAALAAALAAARDRAAHGASALLARLGGDVAATRRDRLVDQQISEGGGVKIILDRPARRSTASDSPRQAPARRVQSFESGSAGLP